MKLQSAPNQSSTKSIRPARLQVRRKSGSAITRERSEIAAKLRDKIDFVVIFDSARITSLNPT
jgi:hypothetical protein